MMERMEQQCPNATTRSRAQGAPDIYLASDNAAAKMQIQRWDRDEQPSALVRTNIDMDILHIDRSRLDELCRNSLHQDDENDNDAIVENADLNVWAEFQVLLDATCLVTSQSKFSTMAVKFGSSIGGSRCAINAVMTKWRKRCKTC
mmetsp:Transcript_20689/g.31588  ORF Transcript_20689/g.31588 Transcript_20689/m.31588 type:complete len:146 (-) Transcript_20689:2-439(-)